jgi:hypothetical protein
METVVYDSNDDFYFRNEDGLDQSLSGRGGIPSRKYIENIFKEYNINYELHNNIELNADGHVYDWVDENNNTTTGGNRRFWILNK